MSEGEPLPGSKRDKARKKKAAGAGAHDPHRPLPAATEAERALLASFAMMPREVGMCLADAGITPEHMHVPTNGQILAVMQEMWSTGANFDFVMLHQELHDRGELEQVGGAAAISELWTFGATPSNVDYYVELVQEKHAAREIIATGNEFARRAHDADEEIAHLLEEFQSRVIELGQAREKVASTRHIRQDCQDAAARYEARYKNRGHVDGLETGFVDFDRTVNGLRGPNVYVIGARPAMGKTSFGTEIAAFVSMILGAAPVTFFSIEMTRDQIVDRLVCSQAKISNEKLRRGFFSDSDLDKLMAVLRNLGNSNLWLDDSALTPQRFRSLARRAVLQRKSKLLVVDYIQRFGAANRSAESDETQRVSQAMAAITATAKELNVPIIALAQVNRDGSRGRRDHRPTLADLKQSGTIEEDAYLVGLLHRPVYYCKNDAEREKAAEECKIDLDELDCYAELDIAKHRNGGVGTVPLRFMGEFTRFEGRTGKLYSNNAGERQGARTPAEESQREGDDVL